VPGKKISKKDVALLSTVFFGRGKNTEISGTTSTQV
jgi:hypothetical protein